MICGEFANHTIASVAGPLPIFYHSLSQAPVSSQILMSMQAQPQSLEPPLFARFLLNTWNYRELKYSSKTAVRTYIDSDQVCILPGFSVSRRQLPFIGISMSTVPSIWVHMYTKIAG